MRNLKTLAAAFTLFALGAMPQLAPVAGAQAGVSTLEETLKRLGRILTRHGSKSVGGVIRRFDAKDFRGCRITYELTPQFGPGQSGFVPFIERTTIDLSYLDPARVVVTDGRKGTASLDPAQDPAQVVVADGQKGAASVNFFTRGGESRIESRRAMKPHHFGPTARFDSYHISLKDKAAAEEVRAALVQAIELCQP